MCCASKKKELKLYAVNQQNSQNNVEIIHQEHNQMAFKFSYKKSNYYMAVQGSDIKMMKAAPVSSTASIPSSYLFRKVDMGGGHHYGLTSVERPCKYISRTRQSPDVLTLSDNYMECLLITDEKKTATD